MQWTTTSRVLMVTGLVGVAGVRRRRLRREPVIGRRRRAATPAPQPPVAPAIVPDHLHDERRPPSAESHDTAVAPTTTGAH